MRTKLPSDSLSQLDLFDSTEESSLNSADENAAPTVLPSAEPTHMATLSSPISPESPLSEGDIMLYHTDFIADSQGIWCFLFKYAQGQSGSYSTSIIRALLSALRQFKDGRNKQVRECAFTIWGGDYSSYDDYFVIGIPLKVNKKVTDILQEQFRRVKGYESMEGGSLATVPIIPLFRYEKGTVIEYSDESMAGRSRLDGNDNYGSGLTINYRLQCPAYLNDDKECYGGLLKER